MDGKRIEEKTWRSFQKARFRLNIDEKLEKSWTLAIPWNYDCRKFRKREEESQKLTQKLW
jgi:hypothetical protein